MRVAALHIHPVKGMRALDVERATVEPLGLAGDRRWLVVDSKGVFLTQRGCPVLATINARLDGDALVLARDDAAPVKIQRPDGAARRRVTVWDASIDAACAGEDAAKKISALIGEDAMLVHMDERALREKKSVWTADPVPVSFADAFPVLVTTTGSLRALNEDIAKHGGAAVPMARFRPNVVIDCDEPWAEDRWSRLNIGDVVLDLVKPSDRCIVTTMDQRSGERMGKEPLASLARIHRSWDTRINGVIFGMNAVPRMMGEIRVGDRTHSVA